MGFGSGDALMLSLDPGVHGYTAERTVLFLNQLRERVAAMPGVTSAVVTDVVPLSMGTRSDGFQVVGNTKPATEPPIAELYMASPGYFQAIGIPSLMGRDFSPADANGPRVAIVNRVFAERLFGHENPDWPTG